MLIKKAMDALKKLEIKGMLIKAPSYNVSLVKEDEYEATKQGLLPKIIGYKVRQDFTVLLKNEDISVLSKNAAQTIDTALDNGVNIIQEVSFFKEDDSKDKHDALALAVKNAISNAKSMAGAASVSIKDYVMINSYTSYWQPHSDIQMRQTKAVGEASSVPTTLAAGKIAVTCNVQLQCTIE